MLGRGSWLGEDAWQGQLELIGGGWTVSSDFIAVKALPYLKRGGKKVFLMNKKMENRTD